jgi:hypothetical protein
MIIPGTDMRSTPAQKSQIEVRRAWEPPAIAETPIGPATKAAGPRLPSGRAENPPPPPASPSTKLGFSFEMSFPLSVRTDS